MTVIVWDGKTLAGDGRITYNDVIISDDICKVFELDDIPYGGDCLIAIGIAGRSSHTQLLLDRLDDLEIKMTEVCYGVEVSAIVIGNNYVYELESEHKGIIKYPRNQCISIGSGYLAALTALDIGLNAEGAVEAACTRVSSCGGKITTIIP